MAADWADVTFRITDAETREPIKGRYPAAWMDLKPRDESRDPATCQDKVEAFITVHKLAANGRPWDVWVSDPGSVPEEELITEVYYPVK